MIGLFQFRRKNPRQVWAWATYDFANSAFATTIMAVIFNTYYAGVVAGGPDGTTVFGIRIPGATMFTLFVSFSMILIAIASPILGALSDLGRLKKRMLGFHLALGLIATASLYFIGKGNWLSGGILFVIGQFGFAGGNVFYNSMLYDVADEEDFGKVSGLGWAWGYLGGGVLLAINLVMLQFPQLVGCPKGFFTVQDCFLSVAIWWGIFAIPIFRSIPPESGTSHGTLRDQVYGAIQNLKQVPARLRSLPHFTRFFIAYLLYNDGIETVIVMASIFGSQELHMTSTDLIQFFLMVQFIAFFGALAFGWLADKLGNRTTILISLIGWILILFWGWKLGIFGDPIREFWILGVMTALVMGGAQAASRSLQAMLIPPKRSSEFFSFFGISGKFASAVGPFIFGVAVFVTGSLRIGILSLLIFFVAGFVLLLTVHEKTGHQQALDFDLELPYPARSR